MPRRPRTEPTRADALCVGDVLLTAVGPSRVERLERTHGGVEALVRMGAAERILWFWPQSIAQRKPIIAKKRVRECAGLKGGSK